MLRQAVRFNRPDGHSIYQKLPNVVNIEAHWDTLSVSPLPTVQPPSLVAFIFSRRSLQLRMQEGSGQAISV